ncbi:unnamed protein product [Spirodela intermedia]|uniref:Uncharacterized protein n=1 Tax=Spirodela intermedia TaxID=51605 RepID=A0A7I8LJ82_SPIIN|nr:unnamed protein product [Spirodela intermedia]
MRAFLQSIMPAPVSSRSCLTKAADIATAGGLHPKKKKKKKKPYLVFLLHLDLPLPVDHLLGDVLGVQVLHLWAGGDLHGDVVDQLFEYAAPRDEVRGDPSLCRGSARLLVGAREALLPQELLGLGEVAAGLCQSLLAVHHPCSADEDSSATCSSGLSSASVTAAATELVSFTSSAAAPSEDPSSWRTESSGSSSATALFSVMGSLASSETGLSTLVSSSEGVSREDPVSDDELETSFSDETGSTSASSSDFSSVEVEAAGTTDSAGVSVTASSTFSRVSDTATGSGDFFSFSLSSRNNAMSLFLRNANSKGLLAAYTTPLLSILFNSARSSSFFIVKVTCPLVIRRTRTLTS